MVEIILAAHGETEGNATETFRGRADVALNENGLKQAQLRGEYLRGEKIDVIYSSPLQRAVKTAEGIAACQGLDVNIVDNLNDTDCVERQGLTSTEVKGSYFRQST